MSNKELHIRIEWGEKYQISPRRILNREIEKIKGGLQVLTVCNDGSGRSRRVAAELNKTGIVAYSLKGGLAKVHSDPKVAEHQNFLAGIINEEVPYVAVILTREETKLYLNFLSMLRRYQYSQSEVAIKSLMELIKGEE